MLCSTEAVGLPSKGRITEAWLWNLHNSTEQVALLFHKKMQKSVGDIVKFLFTELLFLYIKF